MLIALLSLASPVDFTGYLVDTLCWSYPNHEAPPTRNTPLAERPYDHTLECLRDISFCFDDLKLLAFDNATQRSVVALGVYKGCREAMGPGVGSTEFETQVQVDALTMKGSSKI